MTIDSSVLIAILEREPTAQRFESEIEADPTRLLSAASWLESSMVIEARRGAMGRIDLDRLVHEMRAEIIAFTVEQAEVARDAFRCFGKGRHPAGLNFADCMAYALAKVSGEPLLYAGRDFSLTDVPTVKLS